MAFENIRKDCKRNGIGFFQFLKALIMPNHFNAILSIRMHIWFERYHLPRFIPYRWLLHIHGFELGTGCQIGPGLFLPHPRGVILTVGNNVTVGTSALVLKDMEGDSVVVGFPAKVVKKKDVKIPE
jgi:serine acetyltransferase